MDLDKLKRIDSFRFLKDEELETLMDIGEFFNVKDGDLIMHEGEVSPEIFFISKGLVNVYVEKINQKQAYITLIGEGESFGEAGIFPNLKRTAKIIAAADSLIYKIGRKELLGFISKHTSGGIKILMLIIFGLLRKLRGLNQELAFERQDDAEQTEIDDLVASMLAEL
jgi:CRP/FNR family cyclic AMP-dependent transcriptional regulator